MHTRHHQMAQAHHQHAQLHHQQALAHHQQAQYHHQQARFHQEQAYMHHSQATQAYSVGQSPMFGNQPYDERHTAYANQVSPAALVFHGGISPQAIQSLQQFHQPYGAQNPPVHLSNHMAHAVENQNALNSGYRF